MDIKRTRIADLLKRTDFGTEVVVKGWVRTKRGSKNVSFIALNDGSTIKNVQIVADLDKFSDELMKQINADGLTIGVVTGSGQRPLITRLLNDFGKYLDENHITTAYDVKRGKPNPDPYLVGLQKAGNLHPWEGIVVENAPLGVRAGVAAKIFTVAINSGPLPDDALSSLGANILYHHMTDFVKDWDLLIK